jgi:nitrous oxide reductase accessory protein NosL
MKRTIRRIVLVVLLLVACGSAPVLADSTPVPLCFPDKCQVRN